MTVHQLRHILDNDPIHTAHLADIDAAKAAKAAAKATELSKKNTRDMKKT